VEDLVTSGVSVFETVQPLQDVGLKVKDVVVLVNREQGGEAHMRGLHCSFEFVFFHRNEICRAEGCGFFPAGGLRLHAVVSISALLSILTSENRISEAMAGKVRKFIRENQTKKPYKQNFQLFFWALQKLKSSQVCWNFCLAFPRVRRTCQTCSQRSGQKAFRSFFLHCFSCSLVL